MCPGLRPEMAMMPSIVDREGPAQTFARLFSNHFTQSWEEIILLGQEMSPEALASLLRSNLEKLYVQSGYWRKHMFKEFFKQMFTTIVLCLTYALADLDVLSRHLAYLAIATAAGRSRVITGCFGHTISSAKLFFNVALHTAVCCLCIFLYFKLSSFLFNASQFKSEAIVAQVVAVADFPFMVFNGCFTNPLKTL